MRKTFIATLSVLILPIAALAKPNDTYPVSCTVLWSAVSDTLQDAKSYGILDMDDDAHTATFILTGVTPKRVGSAVLIEKENACVMRVMPAESSAFSDDDEAAFRKHVEQSLAKVQSSSHHGL